MTKVLVLVLLGLAALCGPAAAQCVCQTMKWATCDPAASGSGSGCLCSVLIGAAYKQFLNCSALVPKCFLMKAQMYRARNNLDTRSMGGKPVESAFVDNDGIYDPDCEDNGRFRAKQCNGTSECWCVNSAGVRRTDKADKDSLTCPELVETYWVRLQLTHKPVPNKVDETQLQSAIGDAIQVRYGFNRSLVKEIQYDPDARLIVVDVKKPQDNRDINLAHMAYYMEKDVKVLPLFSSQDSFAPLVGNQSLSMENILVYYVDAKPPTFTMKNLSGGIIAVIVVVVLAVVLGLLALFFVRRRQQQRYSKTQQREMDPM